VLREGKVKRVLQKLKSEKLSLNAFIYTVFSSRDASIRPWASRFYGNLERAEDSLTAMLSRAKNGFMGHSKCLLAVDQTTPDSAQSLTSPFLFVQPRLNSGMVDV